jgi:pyridoxal phosphate enzyme (YggS family)
LQTVRKELENACLQAGRAPGSVALLAVSKTHGPEMVVQAARAGQQAFGENYLQEAQAKMLAVAALAPELALEWHFIGPIQSNKTRPIAEQFAWVHSVDREKIAQRLSEQRPAGMPPLNICLQINISGEDSKSGVAPQEALALARRVASLPNVRLRGLMAVPEPCEDPATQREPFRQLCKLAAEISASGIPLDTLSMGMSADLEAAVAEGSTMVRIGTAIFGKRDYAS